MRTLAQVKEDYSHRRAWGSTGKHAQLVTNSFTSATAERQAQANLASKFGGQIESKGKRRTCDRRLEWRRTLDFELPAFVPTNCCVSLLGSLPLRVLLLDTAVKPPVDLLQGDADYGGLHVGAES